MKHPKITRLVTAGLIGAGAGWFAGNRMVKTYDWRAAWSIPAPLPTVYEAMTSRRAVGEWWPDMELVEEGREDDLRVGSRVSFRMHQAPEVARLAPPFHIHCLYTNVEPERRLREVVTGDLSGVLETLFREDSDEISTRITFNWYVRVTNPVLNALGYAAERVYRHSHDSVLTAGASRLKDYCLRR